METTEHELVPCCRILDWQYNSVEVFLKFQVCWVGKDRSYWSGKIFCGLLQLPNSHVLLIFSDSHDFSLIHISDFITVQFLVFGSSLGEYVAYCCGLFFHLFITPLVSIWCTMKLSSRSMPASIILHLTSK